MGGPARIGKKIFYMADNFYIAPFRINGKEYISSESYFQCMKAKNEEDHEFVRMSGPGQLAWEAGANIPLRYDWEKVKVRIMFDGNLEKFRQNERIRDELLATTQPIQFGLDYFGLFFIPLKMFWFKWNAKILTRVRAQLRDKDENDRAEVEKIEKEMKEYEDQTK